MRTRSRPGARARSPGGWCRTRSSARFRRPDSGRRWRGLSPVCFLAGPWNLLLGGASGREARSYWRNLTPALRRGQRDVVLLHRIAAMAVELERREARELDEVADQMR